MTRPFIDLLSLAERVERAVEYDQQPLIWDAAIAVSCAGDHLRELLDAGAFLDAAMTMVPEGRYLTTLRQLWDGDDKASMAIIHRYGKTMWTGDFSSLATTPALALVAASLRAIAAQSESSK